MRDAHRPPCPVEHAEIQHDDDGDEDLEDGDELALRDQVGLAGLVNQLGDLAHRAVHRQVLQLVEDDQAEEDAERPRRPGRSSAACGRRSRRRRPGRDRAGRGWPRRLRALAFGGLRGRCSRLGLLRANGGRAPPARSPATIASATIAPRARPNPLNDSVITVSAPLVTCQLALRPLTTCLRCDRAATSRRSEKSARLPRR